jgi:hypothetical protein
MLSLPKHLEFDLTYRHASQLPEYNVHPYSTADARMARRVGEGFDFAIVGQNLLRPTHPEFSEGFGPLVGIKRSIFASIVWSR